MFCTAHTAPHRQPALKTGQRPTDRRIRAIQAQDRKPGQIFTDWASI